jgi:hypothetical protein
MTPCTFDKSRRFVGAAIASCPFHPWLIPQSWSLRIHVPPNCRLTSTGLHRVVTGNILIFNLLVLFSLPPHYIAVLPLTSPHRWRHVRSGMSTCCDADPFVRRLDHVLKIPESFVIFAWTLRVKRNGTSEDVYGFTDGQMFRPRNGICVRWAPVRTASIPES